MAGDIHIRMIGGTARLCASRDTSDDAVVAFYRPLILRLTGEVPHTAKMSRLIGFRAGAGAGEEYRFLGIEADASGEIPEGMIALTVSDTSMSVTIPGRSGITHRIRWAWREETPLGPVGEFSAPLPFDRAHPEGEHVRPFTLTVHAPVDVNNPIPEEDAIVLSDPDPAWTEEFSRMERRLRADFPGIVTRIEHYGSTAVPGVPAKPVIDILVEVPSFDTAPRALIPHLSGPDWEYWEYTDHMIFIKRREFRGPRTHHVHVAPAGHRLWEGLIFRDYLETHPETARAYAALKRELSIRFRTDREAYTEAKTEFIRGILERAKAGAGD
ncbi:MAG: GrpB family protein [Deltaproteobacteria bacterium]|nr:GrpB family protein [Candidatus Zymogenaceae bacterium]